MDTVKRSVVARGNQGGENKLIEHRGSLGQCTILYDTTMVYPGVYTFVETHNVQYQE